ncbi:sulfotransferase ssu-1-like [Ornithodoros turicata]|uniref:sulfotransferase ssu-1-like n=1 Tax=Ornithodoros turicata TaxID=34597 RepID=UPI003139B4FF
MSRHRYHRVDGFHLGKHFTAPTVREVFAYKPRPDDIFIVTYPKCGTTWVQHIVFYVLNHGVPPQDHEEFESKTPFFELKGQAAVENLVRPAAIKTHLPFDRQPYSKDAKYIYIARNPFDCCVSFYHHVKLMPMYDFENGTFDEFFESFLSGEVDFGDYFDHLLSWYPHRNDPNVLFFTYEDLKKDVRGWIQKMADFLGEEYGKELREDPALLERIVQCTSLEAMRKVVNPAMREIGQKFTGVPVQFLPPWAQRLVEDCGDLLKKPVTGDFVRKGQVGGWRSYFTADQVERMKEWIAERSAGSDVMDLWKDMKFTD